MTAVFLFTERLVPYVSRRKAQVEARRVEGMHMLVRDVSALATPERPIWLTYGSLLGFARGGKAICHDDDADFGALDRDFGTVKAKLKSLDPRVYDVVVVKVPGAARWIQVRHKPTGVSGDVSFHAVRGPRLVRVVPERWYKKGNGNNLPTEWVLPAKPKVAKINSESFTVYFPAQAEQVLRDVYGAGWRTPDKRCRASCEGCRRFLAQPLLQN